MYVTLRSSTCFEQHAAHPQEDGDTNYSAIPNTMGEPCSTGEINGKTRIDIHACVRCAWNYFTFMY